MELTKLIEKRLYQVIAPPQIRDDYGKIQETYGFNQ
jgi:hypothetical protein